MQVDEVVIAMRLQIAITNAIAKDWIRWLTSTVIPIASSIQFDLNLHRNRQCHSHSIVEGGFELMS